MRRDEIPPPLTSFNDTNDVLNITWQYSIIILLMNIFIRLIFKYIYVPMSQQYFIMGHAEKYEQVLKEFRWFLLTLGRDLERKGQLWLMKRYYVYYVNSTAIVEL